MVLPLKKTEHIRQASTESRSAGVDAAFQAVVATLAAQVRGGRSVEEVATQFAPSPEAAQFRQTLVRAVSAAVQAKRRAGELIENVVKKVMVQVPDLEDRSGVERAIDAELSALQLGDASFTDVVRGHVRVGVAERLQALLPRETNPETASEHLSPVEYARQHVVGKVIVVQRDRPARGQDLGARLRKPARGIITEARAWDRIGDDYAEFFRGRNNRCCGQLFGKYVVLGIVCDADPLHPKLVTITGVQLPDGSRVKLGNFLKQQAGYSSNNVQFMDGETPEPDATLALEDAPDASLYDVVVGVPDPVGFTPVRLVRKQGG